MANKLIFGNIFEPMPLVRYFIAFLFPLIAGLAQAQDTYDNKVYDDRIRTVIFQKDISIYDPSPIIRLGTDDRLLLSFDHLQPTNEFYNYSVVHCDHNWEPTDLQPMDYVTGNLMGEITDFSFSTNTYVKYTHYRMAFPNQEMGVSKSGNYLLKIYRNFDETDLVLTRRFMVSEPLTNVTCEVKSATVAAYRFSHQEVDFEVDYTGLVIPNPFMDVNVTILQNNSWENAISELKPMIVNGNTLSFNYEEENLFPGGNEFRFFDIRSLRFFSNGVREKYFDSVTNVVLKPVDLRSHLNYARWIDYNGKRAITNDDGVNIVEDGDYAMVHFYLKSKDKSDLGDVYVYGELTDWQMQERFKMKYWPDYEMYSCSVLLKQSYYDYMFAMKTKDGKFDLTFTEGNHQETENDYTILVYHKHPLYNYDQLIGVLRYNTASR